MDTEQKLGRSGGNISAVAGYAGGADQGMQLPVQLELQCSGVLSSSCCAGRGGKVCYYYGPRDSIYESNGHAEVVQLELEKDSAQVRQCAFCACKPLCTSSDMAASQARRQMEMFADTVRAAAAVAGGCTWL